MDEFDDALTDYAFVENLLAANNLTIYDSNSTGCSYGIYVGSVCKAG